MKRILIFSFFIFHFSFFVFSQDRQHSVMAGGGAASVLDTYLSPYTYTGGAVQLVRETQRDVHSRLFRSDSLCTTFQTLLDLTGAGLENPAGNVNAMAGGLRYSLAWLYNMRSFGAFTCSFGPMLSGYLGAVYNERNGNNPAQAKADLMFDLTASVTYRIRVLKRPCIVRYQAAVPFLGMAFSPNYGQSYYEMFELGNYDHNVVFANLVNMPSMRHLLTFDIPLRRGNSATTLRVGYGGEFMQSTFNNLDYHSYTHTLMIGFTKTFHRL